MLDLLQRLIAAGRRSTNVGGIGGIKRSAAPWSIAGSTDAFRLAVQTMSKSATHPTDAAPVIRCGKNGPELVEMKWGLRPRNGGEPVINVRAETADLSKNRCLIPASDFELFTGAEHPKRRWVVRLRGEPLFFFAGLWRPATAHWPATFAALTIKAAADLEPLTDRQMAVIRPADAVAWFGDCASAAMLLRPLPSGSYAVE